MAKIKKMMELEENGDEQQFFPQKHADAVLDLHEYLKQYVIPGAINGKDGRDGTNGLSAYDIAVVQGFKGTATEWINSLKGDKGDTGAQGPKGDGMDNVLYRLTTLVEKPEFSDGDIGGWVSGNKPCVLNKDGTTYGYSNTAAAQAIGNDLYSSAYWKPVASGSKWYAEALIPNFEPTGGKNVKATASLYYIRPSDGKGAWVLADCGETDIAPQHWGWIKGYVTVPDGVTKVRPCISMKKADGTNIIAQVKYCQFTLVNAGVQNQLNELNNKIIKITKIKDV